MDWGKLKEKALNFKDKAVEFKDKTIEKSKEMWDKALDFTSDTMGKAPITLKVLADFEKVKNKKFLAILFIDKDQEISKNFLLQTPLIIKDAWVNWVTFKTVDIKESAELSSSMNVSEIPYVIVYKEW
jgi:hypothetical protein